MTDYLPLLSRAITGLERNTGDARRSVYERARAALLKQLRSMNPPLAESEITRERLALEEAIRRIEAQLSRPPERAAPPPPPPPPPAAAPTPPPAAPFDDFTPEEPAASPPPLPAPAARAPSPAPKPFSPPAPAPRAPMQKPLAPPPRAPAGPGSAAASDPFGESDPFAVDSFALPGNPTTPPPVAAPSPRPAAPAPRRPAPPPVSAAHDEFDVIDEIPAPPPPAAQARGGRGGEPSVDGYAPAPSAQPRPYRGRAPDFAKADAQKAMKAKMIVGGTIGALVLVALLIGFLNRDRIFSMGTSASRPTPSTTTSSEPPKASDRVPSDSGSQQQASRPVQQGSSAAAVAQRAVLYEENPSGGGQQLQTFVGTVLWRTETVNPGPGRPPELGMRIEVEVPDRKMTVIMTIRRNPDTTLPASHTVEVQFTTPGDPFGGVSNVPGLRAKTTETAQGAPLSGLVVRVMPGFFLIGLSAIDADREQNLMLLRERGWLDLPFVYNNGRRAVLVIEKGAPGERVMNEALAAWGG